QERSQTTRAASVVAAFSELTNGITIAHTPNHWCYSSCMFTPRRAEEAEACFLEAIEVARRQTAKSLELRAVMSLSRLWQRQAKKKQARHGLTEIYSWFTEGFDTKDLQEAKALLAELG